MVKQKEGELEKVWGAVDWIGQRLKELRELRGMTGEEVAEKLGVKHSRIYDSESARNDIRASTIFRILDVLGVDFQHFAKTAPRRGDWRSTDTPAARKERRIRMRKNTEDARRVRLKKKQG